MPFNKIIYFFQKKNNKKKCVPTLPKIFRPVTQNTLIFLFGLYKTSKKEVTNHLDFRHGLVCYCLFDCYFFMVFDLTSTTFQNYIHSFENSVDPDQMKSGDQDLHTFSKQDESLLIVMK